MRIYHRGSAVASIDLAESQRLILTALVNLYRDRDLPITGQAIADEVDRAPGTVRNQMQLLRELDLVEGVSGPKGGYVPMGAAYETLGIEQLEQAVGVPVRHDDVAIDGMNVEAIKLASVNHPARCRAEIRIVGSLNAFHPGDPIQIGPTPVSNLVINGRVVGTNVTERLVILHVEEMRTDEESVRQTNFHQNSRA